MSTDVLGWSGKKSSSFWQLKDHDMIFTSPYGHVLFIKGPITIHCGRNLIVRNSCPKKKGYRLAKHFYHHWSELMCVERDKESWHLSSVLLAGLKVGCNFMSSLHSFYWATDHGPWVDHGLLRVPARDATLTSYFFHCALVGISNERGWCKTH